METFGPSGNFEQDDMNNFMQCTKAGNSRIGVKVPLNFQMGLGRERVDEEIPGAVGSPMSDSNQRAFYARWAEMMDAPGWSQINVGSRA